MGSSRGWMSHAHSSPLGTLKPSIKHGEKIMFIETKKQGRKEDRDREREGERRKEGKGREEKEREAGEGRKVLGQSPACLGEPTGLPAD